MKNKKFMFFALAVAVIVGLTIPGGSSATGVMGQIKEKAFEEVAMFTGSEDTNGTDTNGTDTNSTIEEKLYEQTEGTYESLEEVFVLYSDTNSTDTNATNATSYTIGDYEFYFGESDDGYYFGDVNGTMYYIQDTNGTLPTSSSTHLSNIISTFGMVLDALEDGKVGRAFGLLTSIDARMSATGRYLDKVKERNERKEERIEELQARKEERERERAEKKEEKNKGVDKENGKGKGKDEDNPGKGKGKDEDNPGKGKGKDEDNPGKGNEGDEEENEE